MFVLLGLAFALAPPASAQQRPPPGPPGTVRILIHYRAHNGVIRPAWLLLPAGYDGQAIPLVISPHGRGVDAAENAQLWGDLPGEGDFAVINPAGEGRRLAVLLVGRSRADRRPRPHAGDRPSARRDVEPAPGLRGRRLDGRAGDAAARRAVSRTCSPARRRSIRRPTWRAAIATSRR